LQARLRTNALPLQKTGIWERACMKNLIVRYVKQGAKFAPPTLIMGASLLNLSVFQRQFLILIMLVWVNLFFLFKALFGQ
jgi:hypothetical protein